MSPTERKAMIRKDHTDLSLTKQCKLLKVSRSSLYYTPVGVNAETLKLMNEIDRVFTKYPFFVSRQIAAYLPRNGFHAGRYRVRRLMGGRLSTKAQIRVRSIPSIRSFPICSGSWHSPARTTFGPLILPTFLSGAGSSISPRSTARQWFACKPREGWTGRHAKCCPGGYQTRWMPASTPVGRFAMQIACRAMVEALQEAIAKYGKPEIMNSDQGSQFTGSAWITTLTDAKIKISMDGRGRYLDNIFIERLWRSLKQEAV